MRASPLLILPAALALTGCASIRCYTGWNY